MKKQVIEYLQKVARGESQKVKEEFLNIVMSNLFCMATEPELLKELPKLPQKDREILVSEAQAFLSMPLWKILIQDMKAVACRKMYQESKSWEEMLGGKFMLYTIEVLEKKIENLSKIKV